MENTTQEEIRKINNTIAVLEEERDRLVRRIKKDDDVKEGALWRISGLSGNVSALNLIVREDFISDNGCESRLRTIRIDGDQVYLMHESIRPTDEWEESYFGGNLGNIKDLLKMFL